MYRKSKDPPDSFFGRQVSSILEYFNLIPDFNTEHSLAWSFVDLLANIFDWFDTITKFNIDMELPICYQFQ